MIKDIKGITLKKRTIVISGILLAIGLLIGVVVYAQSMIKRFPTRGSTIPSGGEGDDQGL